MKINKFPKIPASRTRVLFAAAAMALVPFAQTASAINFMGSYSETFNSGNTGNSATELPAGYTAFTINSGVATLSYTGPTGLPNSTVATTGTVGQGFYYISSLGGAASAGLNPTGGIGTTGIGTVSGASSEAYVLELFNNTTDIFESIDVFYTAQIFRTNSGGTDSLEVSILTSPVQLTGAALAAAIGSGAGFTAPISQSFPGNAGSAQIPGGGTFIVPANYDPGEYLYVRFLDTTAASKGIALNVISVDGDLLPVPEPSTWVAAGLLLGCVGYGSIRRKAKVDAEALPAA